MNIIKAVYKTSVVSVKNILDDGVPELLLEEVMLVNLL